MQDRPIIFNVQSKKSILIWFQISYYNQPLKQYLRSAELCIKDYPQQSEKAIKIFFSFPTPYLCETGFHSTSTNTYYAILNSEVDMGIQLCSINQTFKGNLQND